MHRLSHFAAAVRGLLLPSPGRLTQSRCVGCKGFDAMERVTRSPEISARIALHTRRRA